MKKPLTVAPCRVTMRNEMYTRVFESILDSSINLQSVPASARWLWITMLIVADRNRTGIVDMPLERLAAKAGLSVAETEAALELLGAPDPESRSQREDGRRIIPIREDARRGWQLVNWEEYKRIATEEQNREATRRRVADFRAKKRGQPQCNDAVTRSNSSEAEADAATKAEAPTASVAAAPAKRATARDLVEQLAVDDELRAYGKRLGVKADDLVDEWRDYFRGNGYKTGRNPVADARATFRRWMRTAAANPPNLFRSGGRKRQHEPADGAEEFAGVER